MSIKNKENMCKVWDLCLKNRQILLFVAALSFMFTPSNGSQGNTGNHEYEYIHTEIYKYTYKLKRKQKNRICCEMMQKCTQKYGNGNKC